MNLDDARPAPGSLLARQRAAHDASGGLDEATRLAALATLDRLLGTHADALAAAIDRDFRGRSREETRLLELFPARNALRHARRHVRRWSRPRRVPTSVWFRPGRSFVVPQPLGVVGILVPWNYPVYLAVGPLASALAAGNRCLVKMPEATPATSELLARLVTEAFAPEVLAVVTGGPDVGRAFSALPFDHLLFTGSTAVGREVMQAAARNLTPVTLELGGKSPAIVGRGIAIDEAAQRLMHGKCLNGGQTCIAPDYALVPRESVAAFVAAARDAVSRRYPTLAANPDYTAVIDERHRARLQAWIDEARSAGATIVEINPAGEALAGSPKLAPTLVLGAPPESRLLREEIFGPVLPVVPYDALEDAIAYVNARPRPLALYVFDRDESAISRVLARTVSGGVTVNDTLLHVAQEELPFGGVGPSGMGEYHGRAGFDRFSKLKAVYRPSRFNGARLLAPPYGPRVRAMIDFLLR